MSSTNTPALVRPNTPKSQAQEVQHYLLKFMPTLTDALTEMSLKRPSDPQAFLAQYLLARSSFPQKSDTCAAILAHAGVAVQEETVVGNGTSTTTPPPKIIIAGAPCSGKGTQCEYIKSEYGVFHLSTGDMLRAEVAAGTPLGIQAKKYMDNGQLIPDDLIINIVKAKVTAPDVQARGWLLDGFPRTAAQAKALQDAGIHADLFLQLNVPDPVLIERVTGRRTDETTGRTYHTVFDPPPPEVAARCIQRSDDTEEKIQTRLKAYHQAISAIEDLYQHVRTQVDGNRKKEHVTHDVKTAIERVIQLNRQKRQQ